MSNMDKFRRMPGNGLLHRDVQIAFSLTATGSVVYAWIGTRQTGIILQYSQPGSYYAGVGTDETHFTDGAWTPCYSRGNFGKNYSHGGTWSGHTKHLHPRVADGCRPNDVSRELLAVPGSEITALPEGIRGDITQISLDCSFGWAIFFSTAREALEQRLSCAEIAESALPAISKQFLAGCKTDTAMANLRDVIDTYKL